MNKHEQLQQEKQTLFEQYEQGLITLTELGIGLVGIGRQSHNLRRDEVKQKLLLRLETEPVIQLTDQMCFDLKAESCGEFNAANLGEIYKLMAPEAGVLAIEGRVYLVAKDFMRFPVTLDRPFYVL